MFVSFKCETKYRVRSQKSPCEPLKPKSLGSCVLARKSAIPHLKPTRTVSDTKFTTTPAFASHPMKYKLPVISAVQAAKAAKRRRHHPASSPSDAPTSREMADVTVIAVCRELQNNQKISPANMQAYRPASGGRLANEASPKPAGMR